MKRKVLVTGATGFIGHYVVEELLRLGHSVVATSANAEKARNMPWINYVNYISFRLDGVSGNVNYFDFFDKPDLLIHLAWEGLPNYKSDFHILENLPRHEILLSNIIENGLRDVTVTGTCFEYGMQNGMLVETQPAIPINAYARAKDTLRNYLENYRQTHSFSFKWLRLFYMYGTGQNANSLLSQLEKALKLGENSFNMSGGEQVRDFLPVEKMAAYIVATALQQKVEGIINVGSGQAITVKQFVVDYLQQQKKQISLNLGYYPYPDFEPMYFWADTQKLNSIINSL